MNKTGTKTLGMCFRILWFKNISWSPELLEDIKIKKDFTRVFDIVSKNDSFEDMPFWLVYKELDQRFPDSKFILTVRKDKETWLKSFIRHCDRNPVNDKTDIDHKIYKGRMLSFGYSTPKGHEKKFLEIYEKHIAEVRDYFADRPEKLLIVCWECGDQWEKICHFLNKPIPNESFPWENKKPNVQKRILKYLKSQQYIKKWKKLRDIFLFTQKTRIKKLLIQIIPHYGA